MYPTILEELWQHSPVKGSSLLLLLAIARHANHDGTGAYPSLATLKRLTRLSHSQVCLLLKQLVDEGHLAVTHGAGPGGTNAYSIMRTWDKQTSTKIGHAKIGHAKSAHAIAHPKIGHNQEPKEREKISVASSDVRKSDMRESDRTAAVTEKAAHLVSSWVSPAFSQVLQGKGKDPDPTPAPDAPGLEPRVSALQTPTTRQPRGPALYVQGKLCPRGHDDGTGHTLRLVSNHNCPDCNVEQTREKRQAHAAQRVKAPKRPRTVIMLAAHRRRGTMEGGSEAASLQA